MTITRTILAVALTTFGLTATAGTAQASHRHIETLAHSLDVQIRELAREVQAHYRHTSQYRHLISDAGTSVRMASHIHGLAHKHGSAYHMNNDLHKLDNLYHHMSRLIKQIEHDARHHGVGHVHGNTLHVRLLLSRIHRTMQHLHNDVNEMLHHSHYDPHHRHGKSHGTRIRIGNSGFSIRIGH